MKRRVSVDVRPTSMRIVFQWEGERRRETLKTHGLPMEPTPKNELYARRLAAEIDELIRRGTFAYADYFPASPNATTGHGVTLGEWLDTWLAAQRIEASTRSSYSSAVRFWRLAAGDRLLRLLLHSELLAALAARPDLSGKTVNNYVDVLHQAMVLAVRDRLVAEDPSAGIPRASWQRDPPDPFTLEEVERIVAAMPEGQVRNLVEFWAFTGLRTSEMAGLQWLKVDLASGYVRINEAMVRGNRKNRTKTAVVRDVLLNSRAMAALQRQRAHTQVAGQHVWLDPRYGTPWTEERAFRRSFWTPTLKRLGIRYRRPYNLRHSYATMLLMMPEPNIAWNASQMGHSIEVYLRTYAKWIHGAADRRQVAGFDGWLQRSGA